MDKITISHVVEGELKDVELPLAPTPLAKLVAVKDHFLKGIDSEDGINALTTALFYGIRRAGGQVTLEWLQENVDQLNQDAIFRKFIEVNHLAAGKDAKAGEAGAGAAS